MKKDPRITAITAILATSPELLARVEKMIANCELPRVIQGAADACEVFTPRMMGLTSEELHAVFINRRNGVLGYAVLTRGNDAHTIVDPRQIYREAIRLGASGLILAHNHPSGDPTPSMADVEVTERVSTAGQLLGIELLDHLIITDNTYRSMREDGLISPRAAGRTGITGAR